MRAASLTRSGGMDAAFNIFEQAGRGLPSKKKFFSNQQEAFRSQEKASLANKTTLLHTPCIACMVSWSPGLLVLWSVGHLVLLSFGLQTFWSLGRAPGPLLPRAFFVFGPMVGFLFPRAFSPSVGQLALLSFGPISPSFVWSYICSLGKCCWLVGCLAVCLPACLLGWAVACSITFPSIIGGGAAAPPPPPAAF